MTIENDFYLFLINKIDFQPSPVAHDKCLCYSIELVFCFRANRSYTPDLTSGTYQQEYFLITLQKSRETAGIHLQKKGLDPASLPHVRAGLCLDVSGSMRPEYRDGHVQDALTHLLALAMHMDKSGRLDVFTFENDCAQCRVPATPDNYETFVRDHILDDSSVPKWGGTDYLGVMSLVYRHYFNPSPLRLGRQAQPESAPVHGLLDRLFHRQDPSNVPAPFAPEPAWTRTPTLAFFLTDGETENERQIERLLESQAPLPLFWVFVGLNHQSSLLTRLGREPDSEFILLEDGVRISDDRLYEKLVTPKLVNWLARLQG